MDMLHELHPLTWQFHQNTSRWYHNIPDIPDVHPIVPHFKEYVHAPVFELPNGALPKMALQDLIQNRHSCRRFKPEPIHLEQLASMLRGGYGLIQTSILDQAEFFERTIPSAGGLYPLELYILAMKVSNLPSGIYHYSTQYHHLEQLQEVPLSGLMLSNLFMNQPYIGNAAAMLIITSCFERNMMKYGDRGYRYTLFEAGHCMQNMNLIATGFHLGTLNLGGFFDHDLAHLLTIDKETECPLYAMAIGVKDGCDKMQARTPI
jgi:SagB-type dehydrogenase family enzyme